MTRKSGDLPERRHPSAARGARVGRASAVVTERIVTRWAAVMGLLLQKLQKRPDWSPGVGAFAAACGACAAFLCWGEGAAAADLSRALPTKAPPPTAASAGDDWTGFYAGGHLGYAAGFSNWTATQAGAATPSLSGALDMFQGYNFSTGKGSYLLGFQASYNYMLPSRVVLGVEADVSFPSVLGASQAIASPLIGQAIYRDEVQMSGTLRGRIGTRRAIGCFMRPAGSPTASTRFRVRKLLASRSAAQRRPAPSRISSWCRASAPRPAPASKSC